MVSLVNLRAYWRFFIVARQFFPLLFAYARDRNRFLVFGRGRSVDSSTRRQRAEHLLDTLLTLGPTFIKLGQLLSTRPDILPPEYIQVLSQLQDEVPPADWEDARTVIEDELGPVDEYFDGFDTESISGASLGQVHRARVDGQEVAVKIRRPNVKGLVEADLRVINWSLPILMFFIGEARSFSLRNLSDEFAKTIREEMNYQREAAMLKDIKQNFADDETIRIPAVIDSRSGPKVLTMEYVPGTKINDIEALDDAGIDRTELATTLQRAYLKMIIDDGVFHADPHPGNLAVQEDGTIVFYDFGMSGQVDPFVQEKVVDFYIAVANQDIDGILDVLVELGTLSPDADRAVMADALELAIADARGEDIETYRVQEIVGQIEDSIYEFPFRLPKNLALVLRVATVVEGVCVTLDPDFDFITIATDYLSEEGYREETARRYLSDAGEELQDTAESLFRVPPKVESALDRIERENFHLRADIEDSDDLLDRLAKRLVLGILVATGTLSTALLYAFATAESAAIVVVPTLLVGFLLYRSFTKRRGIRASPQFTRQNLREREEE
ncbi:ABC1 kinase family protein [Natronoarchaeum sp. GCM10025321]|uniref:ABC1 kinase family protein n=1 Tax=Natronoarchaeum sp. GCM10025321 TaxID=3252684 RepID=UPI00360F05C4